MIIIVVDPNSKQLMQTKVYLEDDGNTVFAFCDPMVAVQYGYNNEVDAVYTEIEMPHISGVDMIRLLRKRHSDIKTYFVTDTDKYLDVANQCKITGYYIKHLHGNLQSLNVYMKGH